MPVPSAVMIARISAVDRESVQTSFLYVQDLTPKRQNRLEMTITTLFSRTAGRVTFYDVKLTDRCVLGGAIRKLTRQ